MLQTFGFLVIDERVVTSRAPVWLEPAPGSMHAEQWRGTILVGPADVLPFASAVRIWLEDGRSCQAKIGRTLPAEDGKVLMGFESEGPLELHPSASEAEPSEITAPAVIAPVV
jgi:hypothetical protein